MDRHTLALISIAGSSFDLLGAMYLAYDLLGGEHGPLRTLTRGVTYATLFGLGYGIVLGPVFGLASGVAHGITLAWEFSQASQKRVSLGFGSDVIASATRGLGFGVGAAYLYGPHFGLILGVFSALGQILAYRAGIRPTVDYHPALRFRLTRIHVLAAVNRTVGYTVTAIAGAALAHLDRPVAIGLRVGLTIGIVTAASNACTPLIEWAADNVPERRMGVFGVALILIGFAFQSVQYWAAFLDIPVK